MCAGATRLWWWTRSAPTELRDLPALTERFIQKEWAGYRDQKAFAHSQATKDWVLLVDSDERVSPALRDEIRGSLARDACEYSGFAVPRLVFYLVVGGIAADGIPTMTCACFVGTAPRGAGRIHMRRFSWMENRQAEKSTPSFFLSEHRRSYSADQPLYFDLIARVMQGRRQVAFERCDLPAGGAVFSILHSQARIHGRLCGLLRCGDGRGLRIFEVC